MENQAYPDPNEVFELFKWTTEEFENWLSTRSYSDTIKSEHREKFNGIIAIGSHTLQYPQTEEEAKEIKTEHLTLFKNVPFSMGEIKPLTVEDLKKGVVFYGVRYGKITKFTYLDRHPNNPKYHILIDGNTEEPVRKYATDIILLIGQNLRTYDEARELHIANLEEQLASWKNRKAGAENS